MSVMQTGKVKQTRKDHYCAYCNAFIPKGSKDVEVEHGIYDNVAFRRYCCAACYPIVDEFWAWCDYECSNINTCFEEFIAERYVDKR